MPHRRKKEWRQTRWPHRPRWNPLRRRLFAAQRPLLAFKDVALARLGTLYYARLGVESQGATMPQRAVATETLTRRFGELVAVNRIDLTVGAGQFFGFLGPNGAGKSTTIKMLTGLLAPSSGRVRLLGLDLEEHPIEVKRQIGVVPEGLALFERLTGAEYLNFAGRMYGLDRSTAAQRTAELLDFMQLADKVQILRSGKT